MKRVLFYIPFIKIGGIEKASINCLETLVALGYTVDLLIDYDMGEKGNVLEHQIPKNINYIFIKNKKVSSFVYYLRTLGKKYKIINLFLYFSIIFLNCFYYVFKVRKICKNKFYSSVISFYQFSPSYLTRISSERKIIWIHGAASSIVSGYRKYFTFFYKKILLEYDYVVAITEKMQFDLEYVFPCLGDRNSVVTIYNSIDFNKIRELSVDDSELSELEDRLILNPSICTVTRVDELQKDIKTLINAFDDLKSQYPSPLNLYIIGDGPSIKELRLHADSKEYSSSIYFLGAKKNPYIWMAKSDIFVLSSKYEGFGLVLVEALIAGSFVVSSRCVSGPEEILDYGANGDLFEVGDSRQLTSIMNYALENKDYCEAKNRVGQKFVTKYSREEFQRKLQILLEG